MEELKNILADKGFFLGKNTSLEGNQLEISGTMRGLDVVIPVENILNNIGVLEGTNCPGPDDFIPLRTPLRGEFFATNFKIRVEKDYFSEVCEEKVYNLGPKFVVSPDGPHVMFSSGFARGKGGYFWAIDRHNDLPLKGVKNLFGNRWFSPWHDGTGIDTIVITLSDAQKLRAMKEKETVKCKGCVHWIPKCDCCSVGGVASACRSFFKKCVVED